MFDFTLPFLRQHARALAAAAALSTASLGLASCGISEQVQ